MEILVGIGFIGVIAFLVLENLKKQAKGKIAVSSSQKINY